MGGREHGIAPEAYRADSLADAPNKQNLPQTKEDEALWFLCVVLTVLELAL